jgi:hypothetical protein
VHARAGRDYTRLTTLRLGEDTYPVEVTHAGRIVLQRYTHRGSAFTVLDPESGRRTGLPGPDRFSSLLRITAGEVWYSVVVDRTGATTAILEVAMEDGALGTSDRGVFFYDKFYDFATERLLDVSDIGNAEISPLGGPGSHPVQVWPQRDGRALVVRLK